MKSLASLILISSGLIMLMIKFNQVEKNMITLQLDSDRSNIHISGTSTQHDWSASAKDFDGSLTVEFENNEVKKFNSLKITVNAGSITSSNASMNSKIYKALQADKHPEITFQQSECVKKNDQFILSGKLKVAGVNKTITTVSNYSGDQNEIKLSGSFSIKMSDFNIDPPTLFLGLLKTSDRVDISYSILFTKSK